MNILTRLGKIKTFIFDMDGVLTDGSMLVYPDGNWYRKMNVKDGYALQLAVKQGYNIIVISGSDAPPVVERLKRLGISNVFMKISNKKQFLEEKFFSGGMAMESVLYMGDDVPDLEAMQSVGIAACPADATSDIQSISAYISICNGGEGCVRDVIEKVIKINGHWPSQTDISST